MKSNVRTINLRFVSLFIILAIVATQFAGLQLTAFAAPAAAAPGSYQMLAILPDDVPASDVTVSLHRGVTNTTTAAAIEALTQITPSSQGVYTITQAGIYSLFARGEGYYSVCKLFNVTQDMIDTGVIELKDVATGPLTGEGFEPNPYVQAGVDGIPDTAVLDSRDRILFLYPDEVYENYFSPEALNQDTEFPYEPFTTPAFTERDSMGLYQLSTQDQMMDYVTGLLEDFEQGTNGVYAYMEIMGNSAFYGYEYPIMVFSQDDLTAYENLTEIGKAFQESEKPTIWHQAQIHPNEPASGEGALVMITEMFGDFGADILDDVNVAIVPRVNLDGSHIYSRATAGGFDMNRDHMAMKALELIDLHAAYNKLMPDVCMDGHEFNFYGVNATSGTISSSDDIEITPASSLNNDPVVNEIAREMTDRIYQNSWSAGLRIYNYGTTSNPVISRAYYGLMGSISILCETRGIGGASNHLARRTYSQVNTAKSIYTFTAENAAEIKEAVAAGRENFVEKGKTYDDDDLFVVQHASSSSKPLYISPIPGRPTIYLNGTIVESTATPSYFSNYDIDAAATRTRVRPTAYVFAADVEWLGRVQYILDGIGAYYYKTTLDEIDLQQYYYISGSATSSNLRAGVRDEESASFENGAIVVPMDQVFGNIIASLFEPDISDSASYDGTLVQQGIITIDSDSNYPIYRYIQDDPRENLPAADDVKLSTGAHLVQAGDYFTMNASFYQEQSSNAAILDFTFDGDKFEYANYTPAEGVTVANTEYEAGKARITVITMNYDLKNLGDIMLRAKEDANLSREYQTVELKVEYALKDEAGNKTIETKSTQAAFTTMGSGGDGPVVLGDTNGDGVVDIIDLSNMIDFFGTTSTDSQWAEKYVFFDFNNNGEIDIADISYVAQLIK